MRPFNRFTRYDALAVVVFALVWMPGLQPAAQADPVAIILQDDPDVFEALARDLNASASFLGTNQYGLAFGNDWRATLDLTFVNNLIGNDTLTIQGTLRHIVAPHGEPPNPNVIAFGPVIFTPPATAGTFTTILAFGSVGHPDLGHLDNYDIRAVVTTAPQLIGGGFDITSYAVTFDADHTPEPGSLVLAFTGTFVLLTRRRRVAN